MKISVYLLLVFMTGLGALFGTAIAMNEPFPLQPLALVVPLLFAGIGIWGILNNSSATLILDAQARTATLRRRSLKGTTNQTFSFDELRAVRVVGDSDFKTVGLILQDGARVPVEDVQIDRRNASTMATAVTEWLQAKGCPVESSENIATT